MSRSPLHDFHARHEARFVDFGGWEMPVQYASVLGEHRAVRSHAGIFDVSHLGRFSLKGSGATAAIDRLLCNDIRKISPGRTQYTMMLNPEGGIVDDLIVWWWGDDDFWILPNAANHMKVMGRFGASPNCQIVDLRPSTVFLAIQGPDAPSVFEHLFGQVPGRFRTATMGFEGSEVHVAGTGYTGEKGGELCTDPSTGEQLAKRLLDMGVTFCGLGSRDTLRLEAGLALWGEDIDESTTPVEANLEFAVGLDHEFVGREVVAGQIDKGPSRRLAGFVLEDRGIPRHGYPMVAGTSRGEVTSGNLSPILGKGVGLGYLEPPVDAGTPVSVEIRGNPVPGTIANPPFHRST